MTCRSRIPATLRFVHESIAAFCVAQHLASLPAAEVAHRFRSAIGIWPGLREALVLYAGLADASALIAGLLEDVDPWAAGVLLAAECAAESTRPTREVVELVESCAEAEALSRYAVNRDPRSACARAPPDDLVTRSVVSTQR